MLLWGRDTNLCTSLDPASSGWEQGRASAPVWEGMGFHQALSPLCTQEESQEPSPPWHLPDVEEAEAAEAQEEMEG